MNKVKFKIENNEINSLTNCQDGNFHNWEFINNIMTCKLCNNNYFDLIKKYNVKTNSSYYNKLRLLFLGKLTKKYCLNGEVHIIDINTGKCNLCKIDPETYKYSEKELFKLEEILEKKNDIFITENIKLFKIKEKENIEENEKIFKIMNKFELRFEKDVLKKYSSNFLENYIMDFIERLIKILGKKINVANKTIYLNDTIFIIDHDYLGNQIKNKFTILSSQDIIQYQENHPYFKKDIIFYKDKANKIYVYYDQATCQYLGYSEDNKNFKTNKNNALIQIEYSIKDKILLLGLENVYTNLLHLNSNFYEIEIDKKDVIDNLVRNRIINLKQIITRIQSIIYSVRNHSIVKSNYNEKEKSIVDEFKNKLKNFNLKDKDKSNSVFKHSKYICNQLNLVPFNNKVKINFINHYFKNDILNKNINSDSKLIYFIIMNLNRLLDYNELPAIESELAYLIIKLIQFSNDLYFEDRTFEFRKFEYILTNLSPYVDENVRITGLYQELISGDIDEEIINEQNYDAQEEFDALDIDDYQHEDDIYETNETYIPNDDIDENMEALDGDIDT
jgi:hypothetical protein